ncbi:hypothetical protein IG631_21703 [Alternaria alternata]|nr:hypothetical protein IG631_21703 [Alternaria alternata]
MGGQRGSTKLWKTTSASLIRRQVFDVDTECRGADPVVRSTFWDRRNSTRRNVVRALAVGSVTICACLFQQLGD